MESAPTLEIDISPRPDELLLVHKWRAERLRWLGVSPAHAEVFADLVDWHAVADLVAHGCPPVLAPDDCPLMGLREASTRRPDDGPRAAAGVVRGRRAPGAPRRNPGRGGLGVGTGRRG
jgi:hypothetical protein